MNRLLPILFLVIVNAALAQAPKTLSYQGKLSDSGGPLTGPHDLTFTIYNAASGGTALWTETSSGVVILNGNVSLTLGKTNPINVPTVQPLWMGIAVDAHPEISPRVELAGSLYSLGLALPYAGTVTGANIGISITSSGTNSAGRFEISNPSNYSNTLFSGTNGNGIAVYGQSLGFGNAGYFEILNPTTTSAALAASSNGLGNAFAATHIGDGTAGWFGIHNTSNSAPAITSYTAGTGSAGHFSTDNVSNSEPLLQLNHAGTGNAITANRPIQATQFIGDGSLLTGITGGGLTLPYSSTSSDDNSEFEIIKTGNSVAAKFTVDNPASFFNALNASTNGNGRAGSFTSTGGTNGSAIYGINMGLGTGALFQISNPANGNPSLMASTNGTGTAGVFVQNNPGSSNPALHAYTAGSGVAIQAIGRIAATGTIMSNISDITVDAGYFSIINESANGNGLVAQTSGTGKAMQVNMWNPGSSADAINISHLGTGNAITANRPIQATQFIGDGSLLTGITSGGLTLPYSSTHSDANTLFDITSTGNSAAASFTINNPASPYSAITATANGDGNAGTFTKTGGNAPTLLGINAGLGMGAHIMIENPSNASTALVASTDGTGNAAAFSQTNPASSGTALYAYTAGSGPAITAIGRIAATGTIMANTNDLTANAGFFSIGDVPASGDALVAQTFGTGKGIQVRMWNAASNADAINIFHFGTGNAITANRPIQAEQFIGDGSLLTGIAGLTLPYSAAPTDNATSFSIVKTGSIHPVAKFEINNDASTHPVLDVSTNGNAYTAQFRKTGSSGGGAIIALSDGIGAVGLFSAQNASNTEPALAASTVGLGPAGIFAINNTSSNGQVIYSMTEGLGKGLNVNLINPANTSDAITISHNGTGNAITANRPIQATQFIGDGSLLTNLPSSGLTLPFAGNSAAASAFDIVNTGNGNAGSFRVTNVASAASALFASSSGTGPSVTVTGSNAASFAPAVEIVQFGTGAALSANRTIMANVGTSNGTAGAFSISNATNTNPALSAQTSGGGSALSALNLGTGVAASAASFGLFNAAATAHAVRITATGSGNGLNLQHAGTGAGAEIQLSNASNPAIGLLLTHAGEGAGIVAIQNKATGFANAIVASAAGNGSTIHTEQTKNGRALEFGSGGMRYKVTDVIATGVITTRSTVYNLAIPGTFTFGWTPLAGDAVYVFNSSASSVTVAGAIINPNTLAHMIYIQGGWRVTQ